MAFSDHYPGLRRLRTPPLGTTARAAEVLGAPVTVAVPLQRRSPVHVLVWCAIELVSFALLVATGSLPALFAVVTAGIALLAIAATNQRRVLAVTRMGTVLLAATLRGKATAAIGPAPDPLHLPAPRGVGAALELRDGRWWIDRASYARLRAAREALDRGGGNGAGVTGGG